MQITVQYESQARRAAGVNSESVDVPDSCSVSDCIGKVAQNHGEPLSSILVNSTGDVQTTLLVFLNDSQIVRSDKTTLSDGDTVTLMTPISGG